MKKFAAYDMNTGGALPFADTPEEAKKIASEHHHKPWDALISDGNVIKEFDCKIVRTVEEWGEWLPWDGSDETGPMFDPLYEVNVQVYRRSPKSQMFSSGRAWKMDWTHNGGDDDILFFRERLDGQEAYTPKDE